MNSRFHHEKCRLGAPSKLRSRLPLLVMMAVLVVVSVAFIALITGGSASLPLTSNLLSLAKQIAPLQGGAVVLVVGNRAMNDMLENWVISATAVQPPLKFIVLPLDEEGHDDLLRRGVPNVVRDAKAWSMFSANGSSFGGAGYYAMSKYKWHATLALLREGIDVLMTDPDIVLLRNPLPYISTLARCSMYVQLDLGVYATGAWVKEHDGYNLGGHEIYQNTGFVFFRSAPAMIRLVLDSYLGYMDEQTSAGRNTDDQTHWNEMLTSRYAIVDITKGKRIGEHIVDTIVSGRCIKYRGSPASQWFSDGLELSMIPLNPALFPNFPTYSSHRAHELIVERPFAVHYNWIVGAAAKVAAMKEKGQWFVANGSGV